MILDFVVYVILVILRSLLSVHSQIWVTHSQCLVVFLTWIYLK